MRKIAILGSTGSIGTQALDVIGKHPDLFEAYVLTANNNYELLIEQAREFQPEIVVIANEAHYDTICRGLSDLPIKVYAGAAALCDVVEDSNIDIVLAAMVGFAGLRPTISAIKAKKAIALANKETLVVAGDLITRLCDQYQVPLLPVDSEHSAIFQCLEPGNKIEKILLARPVSPLDQAITVFVIDKIRVSSVIHSIHILPVGHSERVVSGIFKILWFKEAFLLDLCHHKMHKPFCIALN